MKLLSRRAFLVGLASIGGGLAFGYVTTPKPPEGEGRAILCPFLAMNPPDTTNVWTFARGCADNGQAYSMAMIVATMVTYSQKGLLAVLRHEAPNIYRLDQVPGISHDDLYQNFIPELREMAEMRARDGLITLQDLVEMKEWVAEQVGVTPGEASQTETALLFVRSGGDLEAWTVELEDVFRLLNGQRPEADAVVTPGKLNQAMDQASWRA
ncbi:MAG: twin-arginine translocation signal domain-containing protein [Pseudomonadota bacterium]